MFRYSSNPNFKNVVPKISLSSISFGFNTTKYFSKPYVGIGYNVTRISFPHYIVLLKLISIHTPKYDRRMFPHYIVLLKQEKEPVLRYGLPCFHTT